MLVAGSLVLLSLLAQRVTLQAPSSPSLSPVYPWRQPEASVELDQPGPRPGSLAALERTGGVLRRLRGQQPNRLLALVAEAQAEAAQVSGITAPAGTGVAVAFADQGGAGGAGIVTEAAPTGGATPGRSRGRDAGAGGSGPPASGSDGDDNDSARRREDEDEEEPPDDVEVDDDRDQYAQGSDDSGSDEGSAGVVVARNLAGEGASDGSGSDS
jgi:hypothetical protein